MFIIFHSFSCVFWINRVRELFWWLVSVVVIVHLATFRFPLILPQNTQFLGLLLPSIFEQTCKYKSLHFILLMAPICQYMDRFNKLKFAGMIVMASVALFGAYSEFYGVFVGTLWIIG
jgi:hypothetical protein